MGSGFWGGGRSTLMYFELGRCIKEKCKGEKWWFEFPFLHEKLF